MSPPRDLPRQYEVTIERLSHEGRGVAHHTGKAVFVADALPGEQVLARVARRHRRYDEAVTVSVLRAADGRVTPRCPHAAQCGGCSLQHLEPAAQIAHKQRVLLELLRHQANVAPAEILPPVTGPLWGYRRRARLSVRVVPKKGGALVGFREKSSHYVAAVDECAVLVPALGTRLVELRALLNSLSIVAQIPQIEVAADDTHVLLVLRHLVPVPAEDRARLAAFERETGLLIYLQAGDAASIQPLQTEVRLSYALDDLEFKFAPGDFVQVNAALNARLVALALEQLDLRADERVLDLFCGLGNFSLPIARRVARVVGVEGDPSLVARASENARHNAVDNCEFVAADLFSSDGIAAISGGIFDKVLLDPPRSGAERVVQALDFGQTSRVVYVSCNPVTLARDTASLVRDRRFRLRAAGVIDMFPHTAHVESIAVFDRAP